MADATFSNISHTSGSGGSATGVDLDLRPLIIAIRELSASVKHPAQFLDNADIVVPPANVIVHVPEQKVPVVNVTLPEIEPRFTYNAPAMPTMPAPTVEVVFPVRALIVVGVMNMLTLMSLLSYMILKG